jgi:alpha-beta hydrolase superfamily lysophospholipase
VTAGGLGAGEATATSSDGLRLHLRMWPCPASPRAALAFVHGQGDHSGRYARAAAWFVEQGFACTAIDLRGHGLSAGRRGHLIRFTDYLADVDALITETLRRLPDVPLFIVGHSMGALVTFRWSLDRRDETRVRGLVLSSPFVRLALPVPSWKIAPARLLSRIYPSFTLPTGIPLEYLTSDSALVQETASDPLYGTPATARWFTETVAAQRTVVARAGEVRLPLLFLVAGGDRLVDPDAARQLHDAATAAPREWHRYAGLEHEVLNEIRREDVYRDMHAWLDAVLARAPRVHASDG